MSYTGKISSLITENDMAVKAKAEPLTDARVTEAVELFRLAGDATRVKILNWIADGEIHVGGLCERLGQTQPAVSHHLSTLRLSGLAEVTRRGKNNFYRATAKGRKVVGWVRG